MEAVPRMSVVSFDLKESAEPTSFGPLKQYISEYYHEDPDLYSKECYQLEQLRGRASRPSHDVEGTALLKRYYCQLHSIQNRFLLNQIPESQQILSFSWKDLYSGSTLSKSSIKYEMAVILHNFGALHTQLGSEEPRLEPESMKKACTHFQCAAWAFGYIKDNFGPFLQGDLSMEMLIFKQALCFAQAQECIMEKSLCDNRKSGIIAKVTAAIITHYNSALAALLTQTGEDGRIQDIIGSKRYKQLQKYVKFKISYLSCILLLYQGQQSEELQKMGERVVLYQAAFDKLEEARKESKGLACIEQINEALTFTMDVVEAKRKSAKNENEFIYHEEVPELHTISAVQGANLVQGIPFSVTDPDAIGEDIFHRLVPMKAHESSSVYSEEKANLLRTIGTKVEDKDTELTSFMSSLNLDSIDIQNPNSLVTDNRLPQGLVDRCADLHAKPNAIPDLVQSMSNLAETCTDVEMALKEIKHLLKQDEIQEDDYQQKIGQRSNGGAHITELSREFTKYQEANNKAGESNDTLRKAMGLHVHNLKILAQPLAEIRDQIPAGGQQFDEATLKELQGILGKVTEMRNQRAKLYQDLRTAVTEDDITTQLIALESGSSDNKKQMQELFKKELGKHDQLVALLEANLKAQGNILKALTDIYARCAPVIKSINESKSKREQFFSSLQASYDVYEDLLSKSAKGLEFYKKLQGNVTKLLSRVKAACDVQDEERNQKLRSSNLSKKQPDPIKEIPKVSGGGGPKLKDYLKSGNISLGSIKTVGVDSSLRGSYVPPVRPAPVGSENTAPVSSAAGTGTYYQDSYAGYNYYNAATSGNVPSATTTDYSQYYQQQMMGYGQNTAVVTTFQSSGTTATTTQVQPSSTGYVNPIYQNQNPESYYNQYTGSQASPAIASTSTKGGTSVSSGDQTQQWNSMTQQFGSMNIQQPASYQNPTSTTAAYGQYPSYTTDANNSSQQYAAQTTNYPGYNSYGQTNGQYQTPNNQYYQQPQAQQSHQPQQVSQPSPNVQPPIQTVSQETPKPVSEPSNPYPTYPGYSYNPATGTYEYTGSNLPTTAATTVNYSQPSYVSQYNTQPTATSTVASTPDPATYQNQNALSYGYGQVQAPISYQSPVAAATLTTTQTTATVPSASVYGTSTAGYDYTQQQQTIQQPNITQQYYQENQSQPSYYNTPAGYENQNQATSYQQPSIDPSAQTPNQYSNYPTNSQVNASVPTQGYNYTAYGTPSTTQYSPAYPQTSEQSQPPTATVPQQPVPAATPQTTQQPIPAPTKASSNSNLDLLSGIDFTPIPPTTVPVLQPQSSKTSIRDDDQNSIISEVLTPTKVQSASEVVPPNLGNPTSAAIIPNDQPQSVAPSIDRKPSCDNLSICSDLSSLDQNFDWDSASLRATGVPQADPTVGSILTGASLSQKPGSAVVENILVQPVSDPFEDQSTLKWFHKEVERLEKFIDSMNIKTLNGTTPLDGKWKELQDLLVKDESKRQVSVARLFPEKNRSMDCVPYDHARVTLPTSTDNYINAVFVKVSNFHLRKLISFSHFC
ncbi:tyrosine-protein phosphatase non-receptor type 23-like [Uranotaenia lowii]|uniref:tyrosine-protein phosphatase non-receptor type 23-like n=1 Tax=Uranotaenia lowii TaxID=190385 RepID=UPI0024783C23|nr:tyrosine-protein phosphatase non-receptor type 23-like [Uranotaenia lowii]